MKNYIAALKKEQEFNSYQMAMVIVLMLDAGCIEKALSTSFSEIKGYHIYYEAVGARGFKPHLHLYRKLYSRNKYLHQELFARSPF